MKKTNRKKLKKKLDVVFREYIKIRDPCCIICGSVKNLQLSHYFGRVALSTRWNEANSHMSCPGCHILYHLSNPEPYHRVMIVLYGEKILNELELLHNLTVKFTESDLREKIEYFKKKLSDIGGSLS